MFHSPTSTKDFRHMPSKTSLESMVSVRSNTKFFKAVKEPGFQNQHLSLPLGTVKGVDLSNTPLNQIPFRLTQHPNVPFTITASDNAYYESYNAQEREKAKKEKVDRFLAKTQASVAVKAKNDKLKSQKILTETEDNIKNILRKAVSFSMKTNAIKKNGTSVGDNDTVGDPPTFNGTERESKYNSTHPTNPQNRNVDLTELQSALDDGLDKNEIIKIIDRIADSKVELSVKPSDKKSDFDKSKYETFGRSSSPDKFKRNETPDFDYLKYQALGENLGIPPRDFEAYVPLLRILHLEDYDRNDFTNFDMVSSLKFLKQLWKTIDHEKIQGLINYGIVHEVMKVEERKAVRRNNKGNVRILNLCRK